MMKKLFLLTIVYLVSLLSLNAQIKWLSFDEAIKLNKDKPKKILIDVYTDWCGYCKVMDKKTFSDEKVANLINEYFYPVKFDAESPIPIEFGGQTFVFDKMNKVHQLAIAILQGKMSYPSVAYMDGENQLITVIPGFQKPEEIIPMLKYISGDHYKTISWEDYLSNNK